MCAYSNYCLSSQLITASYIAILMNNDINIYISALIQLIFQTMSSLFFKVVAEYNLKKNIES